jgi:hypothetical protein
MGPDCGKTKAWEVGSQEEDVRWWHGGGLCAEET